MPSGLFSGRTVVIVGAGCAAGSVLAHGFADADARVVVIDRDETAILPLAAAAPDRIDALCLDPLSGRNCWNFGKIWDKEPVTCLVQLQILRHSDRPAMAIRSVADMALAVQPALTTACGQIVYMCQTEAEDVTARSFRTAFEGLAPALQRQVGPIPVYGLSLPLGGIGAVGESALLRLVMALANPPGARFGGTLLPVLPRSD